MTTDTPQDRLALDALTVALVLSTWVALGSLVLAIADGLGEHPVRRGVIGGALLAACLAALAGRRALCEALRRRPWLVVVAAGVQIVAAVVDDAVGGAYVAFSLTSIGFAIVAARARTVWLCVAVLELVFVVAVATQTSPSRLADDGELGGVIGVVMSYPAVALLLLALRRLFWRLSDNAEDYLLAIRAGEPVITPALGLAVADPVGARQLVAGEASPRLTPAEARVVEGLRRGLAPKEIAFEQQVKLTTIRTHIKHAKRKTGAKTLPELAALAAEAEPLRQAESVR